MIKIIIFAGFILLGFQVRARAEEPMATTRTLEQLVKEWVDLRREIIIEKEAWKEQEAHLKRERKLLLKEKEMLNEEIEQSIQAQNRAEAQLRELRQEKEVSQEMLEESLPDISEAERDLKKWAVILPASLAAPLQSSFDELKLKERPASQRLRTILTLYKSIEDIGRSVHLVREILETDLGVMREMEVLYLGLAQGFAVSLDNRVAGIGLPGPAGWEWHWRNDLANEVRLAIDFYEEEKVAGFVRLPLKIVTD